MRSLRELKTSGRRSAASELMPQAAEKLLHGSAIDLFAGAILVPQAEALARYAINGDILGTFQLPSVGQRPGKKVAVVDFGGPSGSERPYVSMLHGRPLQMPAQSRYGLMALYIPEEHGGSYVSLPTGRPVTIGRNLAQESYSLGIIGSTFNSQSGTYSSDDVTTSPNHLTIVVAHDEQVVRLQDHSDRGTTVVRMTYLAGY